MTKPNEKGNTEPTLIGSTVTGFIYDQAFLSCSDGYCVFDQSGELVAFSSTFLALYGPISEQIHVGLSYAQFMRLLAEKRAIRNLGLIEDIEQWVDDQCEQMREQRSYIHHLHDRRWMEVKQCAVITGELLFIAFDITHLQKQNAQIKAHQKKLGGYAILSADWFWELDRSLCYVYHSNHRLTLSGKDPDTLIGQHRLATMSDRYVEDQQLSEHHNGLSNREPVNVVLTWTDEQARRSFTRVVAEPQFDRAGRFTGYIGCGQDVTQQHLLNEKMTQLARYDYLTGVLNRRSFDIALEEAILKGQNHQGTRCLCLFDLDDFKQFNQRAGHTVGDELLRYAARLLTRLLGDQCIIGRVGGDDFAAIIVGEADDVVERVERTLARISVHPYKHGIENYLLSASVGVLSLAGQASVKHALEAVEEACCLAKAGGGGMVLRYDNSRDAAEQRRWKNKSHVLRDMQRALANNEFCLYFQPRVNVVTGKINSFEALIRWIPRDENGAPGTPIGPFSFIPVAEETGFITQLGQFVVSAACQQISEWRVLGLRTRLSVNLSTRELNNDDLVERLMDSVQRYQIDSNLLEFEVTESTAIGDMEGSIAKLQRLRDLGFDIAIDDFGTSYSALNYLSRLPASYLKIDRSFVMKIEEHNGQDTADGAIIRAIVGLAHTLGFKVVAEGVETQLQWDYLAALDCDEIQGYLISPPVDATSAEQMLRAEFDSRANVA